MTGLQLFTVIDVAALIAGLAVYLFIGSKQLNETIESALAVIAGLKRGRTRLGG